MRLEHAKLSVKDAEAMTRFLQTMAADFRVRGKGLDTHGRPWRHVGDDDFYIALQTVTSGETRTPYGNTPGMNHLGWEVDSDNPMQYGMVEAQGEGIGGGVTAADAPGVTIYVQVDDLQAVLDQVAALGGKTVQEITSIPGMVTMATFADPAGNVVGLVAAETPPAE